MSKGHEADAPSDERLVELSQAGGDAGFAAFETLVDRYRDRAYRLALTLTKSEDDAEEVVQEAFLNVFRSLDAYRGHSAVATWIYRIVTNAALMRLRSKRRKPLPSIEDQAPGSVADDSGIWPPGNWGRTPAESLLDQELRQQLNQAIENLPETYRAVLFLRDVEGLSNAEVAEALGLTTPTVKARLHRARLSVRAFLERYFHEK